MRPNSQAPPTNHRGFSANKMNRLGAKKKSEVLTEAVKKMKVKPSVQQKRRKTQSNESKGVMLSPNRSQMGSFGTAKKVDSFNPKWIEDSTIQNLMNERRAS